MSAFIGLELGFLVQELAIEVEKQRRFSQSFSLLSWLHHVSVLLALPWYYKYKVGDFFFGAFFLVSSIKCVKQFLFCLAKGKPQGYVAPAACMHAHSMSQSGCTCEHISRTLACSDAPQLNAACD